jgi:hypothetical protein
MSGGWRRGNRSVEEGASNGTHLLKTKYLTRSRGATEKNSTIRENFSHKVTEQQRKYFQDYLYVFV